MYMDISFISEYIKEFKLVVIIIRGSFFFHDVSVRVSVWVEELGKQSNNPVVGKLHIGNKKNKDNEK